VHATTGGIAGRGRRAGFRQNILDWPGAFSDTQDNNGPAVHGAVEESAFLTKLEKFRLCIRSVGSQPNVAALGRQVQNQCLCFTCSLIQKWTRVRDPPIKNGLKSRVSGKAGKFDPHNGGNHGSRGRKSGELSGSRLDRLFRSSEPINTFLMTSDST
jgi:hypothetical protein